MPKRVRIQLNHGNIRALLRSPEVQADLDRRARNIAAAAGEGISADSFVGRNRARADVATDDYRAMHRVAVNPEILLGALDAGAG